MEDPQIVFSLHIPHRHLLQKFFDDFEDGKFLQMIRHPISGLASLFRHYYETGYLASTTAVEMVEISFGGPVISKEHRSQWRGVRLEDIHENPRETMQRVCDWLQLSWDETLLESTVNGEKWWNDKGRPQVSGPNDVVLSQSNDDLIPAFDRFRLSVLSAKRCRAAGYELKGWHKWKLTRFFALPLILIPLKIEFITFRCVPWGEFDRGFSTFDPRTKSFISQIPGILHSIYLGRKVMLGAWLRLFTKDNNPMELV